MRKHHPENERIKRRYFTYLEEAHRLAESTVDQVAAAIVQFEDSTGWRDFREFHIEQARRFKRRLQEHINPETGRALAKSTVHSRLMALKAFFKWLAEQPGYKSRISRTDADYFNSSANDERVAKAVRERPVPTLEQIKHVLSTMPIHSLVERRDRALVAFTILSGARDDAIASMRLRHIDLTKRTVDHDARDVRTKARKSFVSSFFPVGDEVEAIVAGWVAELQIDQLYGPADALFPSTRIALGPTGHFEVAGLTRDCWGDAAAIRRIFKAAFKGAGLPYFNPHSFRNTLVMLGERVCRTPEEFKAWSQNLGHEHVLTTFTSYGSVAPQRQRGIFEQLRTAVDVDQTIMLNSTAREALETLLRSTGLR